MPKKHSEKSIEETFKLNQFKAEYHQKLMEKITPLLEELYDDVEFAKQIVSQSFDACLMYRISTLVLDKIASARGDILLTVLCAEIHGAIHMDKPKTLRELHDRLHFKKLQSLSLEEAEKAYA